MKTNYSLLLAVMAAAGAKAQQACTESEETSPSFTWTRFSESGSESVTGGLVIDANWRWTHEVDGYENCYEGSEWNESFCPDGETCAENCCVDGADYEGTYGITTGEDSVTITLVTENDSGTNVGARLYLTADTDNSAYEMFNLLGNEFTFDVDSSNVECGLNGALYFISMDEDGGSSKYPGNAAGAQYGTGYCDAQCARDLKWITGVGNVENWEGWGEDAPDVGIGELGACCAEMDIWETNKHATSYTPHPCSENAYHACGGDSGVTCGGTFADDRYAGTCDADGCDYNPYRQGDQSFWGPGSDFTLDSDSPLTVVTQFVEEGGSLAEIRRFYVQNGEVIENAESTAPGTSGNSITDEFCVASKEAFDEEIDQFTDVGGLAHMGEALEAGMVLAFSMWTDAYANMLWLDSTYPEGESGWGAERGPCSPENRSNVELQELYPDASVTFSNIRFGPIGTTTDESGSSPNPPGNGGGDDDGGNDGGSGAEAPQWGQCGGQGWSGPTRCASGTTCTVVNDWYHQCL